MTTVLRDLHISRVDRVTDPANDDARITLFKSKTTKAAPPPKGDMGPHAFKPGAAGAAGTCATCGLSNSAGMHSGFGKSQTKESSTMTDIDKDALDPEVKTFIEGLEGELAEAQKRPESVPEPATVIAEVDEAVLVEAAKARGFDITKSEKPPLPTDIPANVQKALDDAQDIAKAAQAEVAVLKAADRERTFVEKAKALPALLATEPTLGTVMHKAADAMGDDSDEFKAFVRTLTASDAAKAEADSILTKERGTALGAAIDPEGEISTLAKARMDADPTLTIEKARTLVLEANPRLYEEASK